MPKKDVYGRIESAKYGWKQVDVSVKMSHFKSGISLTHQSWCPTTILLEVNGNLKKKTKKQKTKNKKTK